MKRIVSTVLTLLLTFSLCFAASATEEDFSELNADEYSELTVQEVKTLQQDVGLTTEEIENMPPHILKMLIEQNGKKLASETITHQFDEGQFMEKSAQLANEEDMKELLLK
ncbi:hypothetical protein P4V64_14320 [Bacillus thuringiensis]|nr:hypothetical protein [Bacillus thuringiensis]